MSRPSNSISCPKCGAGIDQNCKRTTDGWRVMREPAPAGIEAQANHPARNTIWRWLKGDTRFPVKWEGYYPGWLIRQIYKPKPRVKIRAELRR